MDEKWYQTLRLIPPVALGYVPAALATFVFFLPVFLPKNLESKRLLKYTYRFHKACRSFVNFAFGFVKQENEDSDNDQFIIFGYVALKSYQPFPCLI